MADICWFRSPTAMAASSLIIFSIPQDNVLLRTSSNAGHGFGTALSERIAQDTDVFAFLFDQLRMSYKPLVRQAG